MKRYTMLLIALLLIAHLFWGCESTFENTSGPQTESLNKQLIVEIPDQLDPDIVASMAGGETPLFVSTLPNGKTVSIFPADASGDCITASYTYTGDAGSTVERILQIDQSLQNMYLYDQGGIPLSGYSLEQNTGGGFDFSTFSGSNAFGMSQFTSSNEPITIEVLYQGELMQATFADRSEFRAAAQLHQDVQSGIADPDNLSPDDQVLLEKAETVATWSEIDPAEYEDIETASLLVLDRDFQDWTDADYSDDQPLTEMPTWLKKFCAFISVISEICEFIDNDLVCTAIRILEIVCDAIYSFYD